MLPAFTPTGDLPPGVYEANWQEFEAQFGRGSAKRIRAFATLQHLYELADRTGRLRRFLVFGSFVSNAAGPRDVDVDVVLIMDADFELEHASRESRTLFSHADAEARFGASVFWIREGMLDEGQMREFLETWQTKRDGTMRGIVEVKP
jgi:hypothetical protein